MAKLKALMFASFIALALVGCSDDDNTPPKDTGPSGDTAVGPLTCSGDCKDFVFDSITLPATSTQATEFGMDFDNNGVVDNALGAILGALTSVSKDLAVQPALDAALWKGSTIVLLRVQAADFSTDPAARAQAWVGAKLQCCPNNEADADTSKCHEEAKTTCFGGSGEFTPDSKSPTDATFGGSITGGKMTMGPAELRIQLPITEAGVVDVNLKAAQLKGTISGDTITNGVLAGVITKADLDGTVLPTVTKLLNTTLNDPDASEDSKTQIKTLFDDPPNGNGDGSISDEEVANNNLIKTFLSGDVDIDNDGTPELSLGIGFTAIKATIND